MRVLHFPLELIRDYFAFDFGVDLMRYFQVEPLGNHQNITFIRHLDWHFNPQREYDGCPARKFHIVDAQSMNLPDSYSGAHIDNKETEKNFVFAGLFYFMVLVPQTLRGIFGKDVEYDFYRCSGLPMVSAGLGGSLPPKQMLEEASLFPCEAERDNFYRMLTEVVPFMNAELRRFFMQEVREVKDISAYARMISKMGDNVEAFLKKIEEESKRFSASFQNQPSQS